MGSDVGAAPPEPVRAAPSRLRSNRDYVLWWAGTLASGVGNQFALVAMPLMVLLLTASPFQAGLVGSFEALPYILLSLPAGVLVDRFRRRNLLLGSGVVSLVAFASIPVAHAAGVLTVGQLYVVAFVNGCATVVFAVAQQAALPALVHHRHLGAASAQAETLERLAAIVGPPVAAALFHEVWPSLPFLVDALSFAVIVLALSRIRADMGPSPSASGLRAGLQKSDLRSGAGSLLRNPLLRDLTVLNSAGDLTFAGIGLLMIVLVQESGQQGVSVGLVFSMAAVGGLTGSLVANRLEGRLGIATAVIGKHVLTALLCPVLLLGLPAIGLGAVWALISFQVSVVAVIQRKHVLLAIPDDVMGRVQSVTTFLSFGSLPIGIAATGFVLSAAGARGAVAVYTAALVLLAAFSISSRPIRTATRQRDRLLNGA